VKGVVGMGMPIVAMGLFGLVMPTVEGAALLVVPALVTNIWQAARGPGVLPLARRLWSMLVTLCIGTWLGIGFMTGSAQAWAPAALGAVMALYALMALYAPRFTVPGRHEAWASPAVGLSTGLIAGGTGLFVVPMVPYMSAIGLTKDELIQGLGICFVVCAIALGAALGAHGQITPALAWASALALIPAAVGMYLGQRLRDRLRPETFRRWFLWALVLLGAYMVLRTLTR